MLLAPANHENTRLFEAWAKAEGGTAENNPLNTTYPMPWSTNYNPVGVRNYSTPIEGISATASTFGRDKITGAHYLGLWKDLQRGTFTAEQLVQRNPGAFDTWGTGAKNVLAVLRGV